MHIVWLAPHCRPSGGVKVIFRLAQGLISNDIQCTVAINRFSDRDLFWLGGPLDVPMMEAKRPNKYTLPQDVTHLIHFGDGISFGGLPNVKHILYLQGFGAHNYERECINLMYPYDAVIAVSKWLAEIANVQFRHENVYVNRSGVDDIFKPIKVQKNRNVTVLGCLYHEQESKNVNLFIASMNKLYATGKKVQGLFLSAKHPSLSFLESIIFPHSFVINPIYHQIPLVYNSADIWTAPSYNEGFGFAPVEAMACDVPTIIVESNGLDEFVKHRENCLVSKNDKNHMISNMQAMMQDSNMCKTIINNGAKLVKKLTWKNSIERFIDIIKEV